MRIEALRLKNFRAFRDTEWKDIPAFAVVVGANGTGKSTLFKVFEFLRDCMRDNVQIALQKLGGAFARSVGTQGLQALPVQSGNLLRTQCRTLLLGSEHRRTDATAAGKGLPHGRSREIRGRWQTAGYPCAKSAPCRAPSVRAGQRGPRGSRSRGLLPEEY